MNKPNPKQKLQKMLNILVRDGNKCAYCQKKFKKRTEMTIDHVVPKKLGGTYAVKNLVICCKDCNTKKSCMLLPQFIKTYDIKVNEILARFL